MIVRQGLARIERRGEKTGSGWLTVVVTSIRLGGDLIILPFGCWTIVAGKHSAPGDDSGDPDHGRVVGDDRAPYAKAIDKASQVTTAAIMLALPMLLGFWLDKYLATTPLFVILGLVFGMVAGITQLIRIVKPPSAPGKRGQ